jgi:phosphate/sulfate permease
MRDVPSPFTSSFVSRVSSSWFLQILISVLYAFLVLFLFVSVWQRREMRGGSALFVDQAPVRAATHGRILILDGIDKAEVHIHNIYLYIFMNRFINKTHKYMQYLNNAIE